MKLVLHAYVCHHCTFFYISYVCIFLPIDERVNKLERKQSECMNVKRAERKGLTECFVPFCLLLFVDKTAYYLPVSKDNPAHHCQDGCCGNNDCVINMADRYCYQSFFKELFIHIITTFVITVLQMLSTLLSI